MLGGSKIQIYFRLVVLNNGDDIILFKHVRIFGSRKETWKKGANHQREKSMVGVIDFLKKTGAWMGLPTLLASILDI